MCLDKVLGHLKVLGCILGHLKVLEYIPEFTYGSGEGLSSERGWSLNLVMGKIRADGMCVCSI